MGLLVDITIDMSILTDSPIISPPNFDRLPSLVSELRDLILELAPPAHAGLRHSIASVLDPELIGQQAKHGVLDMRRLMAFIVQTLQRFCAPIRDDAVGQPLLISISMC